MTARREPGISPKGDVANVAPGSEGKVAAGDLNTLETSARIIAPPARRATAPM